MRTGISITVSSTGHRRLLGVVNDRNAAQKHIWRCRIVMLTADGVGTNEILRQTDKSKTCVWRWQEGFAREGFVGLLRDTTRPSRIKPLGDEAAERIVALTLDDPPGETTHWTSALMAKAAGVSVSSVQRIWRSHGLQPHRVRQFKLSNDPNFIGQAARCRRPRSLPLVRPAAGPGGRPAGTCHRPLRRREEPDSGARPDLARPTVEERPRRDQDA